MKTGKMEHVGIPDWGVDLRETDRPGVPKETTPRPVAQAHWIVPERQMAMAPVLKRADLPQLTPVFSTAQPPHGLSGALRRMAYTIPDHRVRHWLLLLVADRVDVIESDVVGFLKRAWPVVAVAAVAGALLGRRRRPRRIRRR